MCGLLGMLTSGDDAASYVTAVEQALPCMRHRGPDEDGTWHDDSAVFGFNRLSIIDIAHSHQPISWGPEGEPDRYTMTFNGEIYNYLELRGELEEAGYTFSTSGDGEPILVGFHHWGADVVEHLRGMFAFAIWDTSERQLFLARDPFGIKPLFYATTDHGTVFASEKKCILEMGPTIGLDPALDDRAIEHYVDLQYVPEPETLHAGIRRLESGCTATVSPGCVTARSARFTASMQPCVTTTSSGDAVMPRGSARRTSAWRSTGCPWWRTIVVSRFGCVRSVRCIARCSAGPG